MEYNGLTVPRLLSLFLGPSLIVLAAADASYFRDIRPLIQRQCQGCHQPSIKSGALDLTTYDGLKKGGKRGPAAGTLVPYLIGENKPQMPLGQPPLAAAEIDLFRTWIARGAEDDSPVEATANEAILYLQPSIINALAFSPDGKWLAVSGNREVLIHPADGSSSAPIRLAGLSERILSLVFYKDTLFAAGGTPARFGEIQLWDLNTKSLRRSITVTA